MDDESVSSHLCVDRSTGCVGLGVSGCIATFDDFTLRHLPDSPFTLPLSRTRDLTLWLTEDSLQSLRKTH